YGVVALRDKLWMAGGYDGKEYHNDVWSSSDGVNWTMVLEHAPWTPRTVGAMAVFKDRIWLIGGGVIDGTPSNNKTAGNEVWSSADGISWDEVTNRMPGFTGDSPIVFDGKLWLVGANRDGTFARSSLVSEDGATWEEKPAPWFPRGGVATWIYKDKL